MDDSSYPIPSEGTQPTNLTEPNTTDISDEENQISDSGGGTTSTNTSNDPIESRLQSFPATRTLPYGLTVPRLRSTIISPDLPLFSCLYCRQLFSRRNALVRHEQLHTGKKPYHCLQCNLHFSRMDIYKRHRNSKRCLKLRGGDTIV